MLRAVDVYDSAVISQAETAQRGLAEVLRGLPGVLSVAADPVRRQLIVRFDPRVTDERALRAALWPRRVAGWDGLLLERWPGLARTLGLIAAVLATLR